METLIFNCPSSDLPINSGITTTAETVAAVRNAVVRVYCPHCDANHQVAVHEAFSDPRVAAVATARDTRLSLLRSI